MALAMTWLKLQITISEDTQKWRSREGKINRIKGLEIGDMYRDHLDLLEENR
ncbi:hypothetical protein ACJRO7_006793, partial [Eucalyptus globulus]